MKEAGAAGCIQMKVSVGVGCNPMKGVEVAGYNLTKVALEVGYS